MDITYDLETAAAERRGEFNRQARGDREHAESAWVEFVSLFSREAIMARVVKVARKIFRRTPYVPEESYEYSPKVSWYTACLTGPVSSIPLDLI